MWLDVTLGVLVAAFVLFVLYKLYGGYVILRDADWKSLSRYLLTGRH